MSVSSRSASSSDERPLGTTVARGLGWSFASTILSRAGTFVSGIVLARLLTPEDYGVFTVAAVALVFLVNLNDLGMETALVRWNGDLSRVAPTATTLIFLFSCLLAGGFWAAGPWFTAELGAPEATGIVRVLAIGVVINGIFAVPSATLTRSFRQDKRTYADLAGFAITTSITVILAMMGHGAWSLAWGRLAGNAINSLLHAYFAPERFRPGWSAPAARQLLSSGLPIAAATIVTVVMVNVDYIVVSRMLGTVSLGFYLLAFNLSSWPVSILSVPVARISVPLFAHLQRDSVRCNMAFLRSVRLLLSVTLPVCVLLAVLALPAIRFLYGPKWAPAATALTFLAVLGVARVFVQICFDLFVAVGSGRLAFVIQSGWLIAVIPSLVLGAHEGGLRGVGIAHMLVAAGLVLPAFVVALHVKGIPAKALWRALRRPLCGIPLLVMPALAARLTVEHDLLCLIIGGSAALLVYLPLVYPLRADLVALRNMSDDSDEVAGSEVTTA